jgi:ABC-type transport system substrate-binding protein
LVSAAMMATLALSACSGGAGGAATTAATTAAQTAKEAPAETAAQTSAAGQPAQTQAQAPAETSPVASPAGTESVERDVVNIGIGTDISSFAPWQQSRSSGGWADAIHGIYQGLVSYEYDITNPGQDETYAPQIMKSFKMADDGLSMDCEIYDYITDSAGNHITMDDVLFSYEKAIEVNPSWTHTIKNIIKTGDYTFTMEFGRLLMANDFPPIMRAEIVSKKAYEESPDGMKTTPVGTGPYTLTARTEGYSFTYTKREDFWQTDDSQKSPRDFANVKTINWYVISESAQRTIALEQGTIDICASISEVDLDKFDGKGGYWTYKFPSMNSMVMYPNCNTGKPTSDLNLRLAICYAINNQAIASSVYGGQAVPLYEAAADWTVGYNKAWDSEDNYYHYDIDKAKEYLGKSSYNGEKLVIICQSDEKSVNTAQLLQNFLLQIGIQTDVQSYEGAVFTQYIENPDIWDLMVRTLAAGGGYYSIALQTPVDRDKYSWGGTMNFYYDDALQNLLLGAQVTPLDQGAVDALHRYVVDECLVMGFVNIQSSIVVPDDMTGVVLSSRNTIMPGACTYSK